MSPGVKPAAHPLKRLSGRIRPRLPVRVLLLSLIICSCGSSQSVETYLTYRTRTSNFRTTVAAEGLVEAVRSHVLQAPRIRHQPEVAYLAPEGYAASKGEVVVRFECQPLETAYLKARNDLQLAEAEARTKDAELGMQRALFQAQLKQSEVSAGVSRLQVSRLEFVAPKVRAIEELKLKKAELKARQITQKLASLEEIHKEEQTHSQLKIQQAGRQVKQAETHLSRLEVKAPVDGLVLHERSWMTGNKVQEGDNVYPGMPVAKVPDLSALQAKLQVDEIRAQKLKKGQKAILRVSSLGDADLPGTVRTVAKRARPIKRNSKVKQVEVTVSIDTTIAGLVPGLTVRADVITDEQPDAVAVPRECVFDVDTTKVVYIKSGGQFEAREVSIKKQSPDYFVLGDEVGTGEEISLRQPHEELIER